MTSYMRQPTLETMGLGSVLDIFANGRLPVTAAELVDRVFGEAPNRGSLIITGANGIVGAGKMMQLGSRLEPFGVKVVGLDFPGAPDGVGKQYPGLVRAFGKDGAARIMSNIIRLTYDGKTLPSELRGLKPRFLLEAIPEVLELKKDHYKMFRDQFPDIEIRSVTSGFPARELGVGVAHPAFPHEINKMWEIVEDEPSDVTKLLWALGLVPVPVSDDWSFVLDVLFCGVTNAAIRYREATNMPYWKVDKFVRKLLGPNPLRAHDAIGAAGANFLTWSCMHHLGETYGPLFAPAPGLNEGKESGQNWYPPNHFRPLVDWSLDEKGEVKILDWIQGALFQMASIMLYEKRGHLTHVNLIGELCAQFRTGIVAQLRKAGAEGVAKRVAAYQQLHPEAAASAWHPAVFEEMDSPEWQQLYVNAEHDGSTGVITIARESYNSDVDAEMNRAIDWLKGQGIANVIVTGDFHLATQLVGADTSEFYPALENTDDGFRVSNTWSRTARRLQSEFDVSVAFINGKRALGGMLELLLHCHYVVTTDDVSLGFPEVTLPVIPGMEGCHWPFRKAASSDWPKLVSLLLGGRPVKGPDAVGWLTDFSGPLDDALAIAWKLATAGPGALPKRTVVETPLTGIPADVDLPPATSPANEGARKAIMETITASCGASLADSLDLQSKHSAEFMVGKLCRKGRVGAEAKKTLSV